MRWYWTSSDTSDTEPTATTRAICEARIANRLTDDGRWEPIYCHQWRGLRDVDGHPYCAAPHHRARVEAQVRRGVVPVRVPRP